ncbi:HEAT repeat domain-containing protein [Streptomyces sp. MA25(2023)]|uniref:HEAT repeat domain-containing protein n=1 Tax=Streptomyces sp. MA25(2023) TaxID=3055078 RepID=UPI0025B2746B|nr:HEAT repeat domain-containing protein [Streptomyces sp. MA25(2023)]MDN3258035.1 HEAT repeat domain-containing protein [Streptomyces sp. MA25(2023)]
MAALVERLDHDSHAEVRAAAAHSLAGLSRAEEPGARAVADALARHADSPRPEIRAASLQHAMEHGAPDAYDRLLSEFDSADVHWQFLSPSELALTGANVSLPDEVRLPLLERLERLAASGWPACHVDPDDGCPDADERAEMLNDLLERVRTSS